MLWKLKERCDSTLVVEHGGSFRDEIHFVELLAVGYDLLSWFVDSAIHVHYQLVLKAYVRVQEEWAELAFEFAEQVVRDLVLDNCWQFIVIWKLLDDEVVIVDEGILDELLDRVVELVRDRFFLISSL